MVDGTWTTGSTSTASISSASFPKPTGNLFIGRVADDDVASVGLYGCMDEVFAFSTAATLGYLAFLSELHRAVLAPSVGGAGYALLFDRRMIVPSAAGNTGPGALSGGFVDVNSVGAAQLLGYGSADAEAMSVALWVRPSDPVTLPDVQRSVSVSRLVLCDKSGPRRLPCGGRFPEYRMSLEVVSDRSGASSVVHYELRVDVGAVDVYARNGTHVGVSWADEWSTGAIIPHSQWTFVTVTWSASVAQAYVNGVLVVSAMLWGCHPASS